MESQPKAYTIIVTHLGYENDLITTRFQDKHRQDPLS